MAQKELDGVIEAVRYTPGGRIALVRLYERHGAVWSDRQMMERKVLSERLAQGRRYAIGQRKDFLGSVFETGAVLSQVEGNIVTSDQANTRDLLTGVPVF